MGFLNLEGRNETIGESTDNVYLIQLRHLFNLMYLLIDLTKCFLSANGKKNTAFVVVVTTVLDSGLSSTISNNDIDLGSGPVLRHTMRGQIVPGIQPKAYPHPPTQHPWTLRYKHCTKRRRKGFTGHAIKPSCVRNNMRPYS